MSCSSESGATGLIQTAQTLPFLLFAIPFGMLADRLSRRDVMMLAEAGRAAAILVTLGLARAGAPATAAPSSASTNGFRPVPLQLNMAV